MKERPSVLSPVDRFSEILFGLIMVLTVTGSISASTTGEVEIRTMLAGALGCNAAWGLVDGAMYLLTTALERGRTWSLIQNVRKDPEPESARARVRAALPEELADGVSPEALEELRVRLVTGPADRPRTVTGADLRGAVAIFLIVFFATLPVVLPFVLFTRVGVAIRISNGMALTMLFGAGAALGSYSGFGAVRTGLVTLAVGVVLVAVTIALGG